MLDDLWGLINSFNLLVVFGILVNPGLVLVGSELSFRSKGVFVVLDVLGNNSDFLLGFSEGVGGVLSQLGKSNNLGLVISNSLFEVIDKLFAWNLVIFVDGVGSLLVSLNLCGDVVQEEVNLVDGGTSGEMKLDDREDWVTQGILVNFSKDLSVKFVLLGSDGKSQSQSENQNKFHYFLFY